MIIKNYLALFTIFVSFAIISSSAIESKRFRGIVSPMGQGAPTTTTTGYAAPQTCIATPKCIPRQICQPKIQCRPRPVQLPACEEFTPEVKVQPVEEDIVRITKTELPYCEYRKYCTTVQKVQVPYCPEPEIEPPVTITPPVIVPPKIIKCGLLSICCWEGYDLLPESFWLNSEAEKGRDYIAIGNDGKYLSADDEGKITISTSSVGNNELWRVTKIATGIIHIMSYYGGYLTIKEDGTVDAKTRLLCDDNYIHILYSKNNCEEDDINYIALRAINGKYLTILENEAASVDKIKATTELFKGHLFDEKKSKCYGKEPEIVQPTTEIEDDDDMITTITPTPTKIPKECLDLSDKILSIECKVIMDKIKKEALTTLGRARGRGRKRY